MRLGDLAKHILGEREVVLHLDVLERGIER
jgi:hypothetical protein